MVLLERGYLIVSESEITAFGYAVNKPRRHEYFISFEVKGITVENEAICIESKSGARYRMMFENINIEMYEYTEEALGMSEVVADLNKYRAIVLKHEEKKDEGTDENFCGTDIIAENFRRKAYAASGGRCEGPCSTADC